jgi:hypothetical protein
MAYWLIARDSHGYLSPDAVLARLVAEFPYVATSKQDGRRFVRGMIQQLQAIKKFGETPVDREHLERLERLEDEAIYVYFEDWTSEAVHLGTAIIPGEPLFFMYSSSAQEQAARPLLLRCAKALDYEIVDV